MLLTMPYSPEHKHRTHVRILTAASKSFRAHGALGTGIDVLMADAGLTRGGFYAHFASKSALFAEVLGHAFDEARQMMLASGLEARAGRDWILGASRRYLTSRHRDMPDQGCAIPSLGAEVARASDEVRETFGRELAALIAAFAERGDFDVAEATAMLATCVGAMTMARAVKDPAQSDAILNACRQQIAKHYAAAEDAAAVAL
jgi:TetR/AcrR family transcriptional repressor of nem operon